MNFVLTSSNSVDARRIIEGPERRVVPLVVLSDESELGAATKRALARTVEQDVAPAVLTGQADAPGPTLAQIAAVGFRQRMAPLRLWENQPVWCVWFAEALHSGLETVLQRIITLRLPAGYRAEHIVVLRADSVEECRPAAQSLAEVVSAMFWISEKGIASRPLELLTQAAVVLIYSAWRDHCASSSQEAARSLLLSPNHRAYVLGASCNEPDWEYHKWDWSRKVAEAVLQEWQKPHTSSPPVVMESAKDSLELLLKPGTGWNQATSIYQPFEQTESGLPQILVGAEVVEIQPVAEDHPAPRRLEGYSARRKLAALLAAVKSLHLFLNFSALANIRRLAESRENKMESAWLKGAGSILRQPAPAHAFLSGLRNRLVTILKWANEREAARVVTDSGDLCFPSHEQQATRKILDVPSTGGVLLRLLLIGCGLGWLVVGPIWASPMSNWQREVVNGAAMLSIGSFVVIALATAGHWFYFHFRALRAVEQLREHVMGSFAFGVASIAAGCLNRVASRMTQTAQKWVEDFEAMTELLRETTLSVELPEPCNRNPFFPGGSLDSILSVRLRALTEQVHMACLERWSSQAEFVFDPVAWRRNLLANASATAGEALGTLTFADCIAARKPSSQELQHLSSDLCREARMPSLDIEPPSNPSPVLLVGDGSLFKGLEGIVAIEVRNVPLQRILAVAVIPISNL